MIDTLLELALGNAIVSLGLAVLAYAVHRRGRHPALAHLLWVLVLVKAVTPPLLTLSLPAAGLPVSVATSTAGEAAVSSMASDSALGTMTAWLTQHASMLIGAAWATGSLIVLTISVRRVRAFGTLLEQTSTPASPAVMRLAESVARELDLRSIPSIDVTTARITPMTWWARGRVRLVLPDSLLQQVESAELRWVLAHELAHIKRRDHLVRWLEWLAGVAFWWNPVVWWARRTLRVDEEDACDAFVLEHVGGASRDYAGTLLTVVEVLSQPRGQAPAVATGLGAASSLERRLSTIITLDPGRRFSRPLVAAIGLLAIGAMASGIGASTGPQAPVAGTPSVLPVVAATVTSPPAAYAVVSAGQLGAPAVSGVYMGTGRADVYVGNAGDESISGFAGDDQLDGAAGDDEIRGGAGRDTLRGGPGDDELHGGAGRDMIRAGRGQDTVLAGAGNDVVHVWTDGTPDVVDCGDGNDRVIIDRTDTTRACEQVEIRDPS